MSWRNKYTVNDYLMCLEQ